MHITFKAGALASLLFSLLLLACSDPKTSASTSSNTSLTTGIAANTQSANFGVPASAEAVKEASSQLSSYFNGQNARNPKALMGGTAAGASVAQGQVAVLQAQSEVLAQPIYRFFNTMTNVHFFTISEYEKNYVIANHPKLNYEGVAYNAYAQAAAGLNAVYRLYNRTTGTHFYTINAAEKDYAVATWPQIFSYEGIGWYASQSDSNGWTPVFRFYNRNTASHYYTADANEKDNIIAQFAFFNFEGIGYYVKANALPTSLRGIVTNGISGAPLSGVTVSVGAQTTQTDASGAYTLPVPIASNLVVSYQKAGFVQQTKVNNDISHLGDSGFEDVPMLPIATTVTFPAASAQIITVANSSAQVTLPADAFKRADGSAPQGNITASVTPIDPSTNVRIMPGSLTTSATNTVVPIESFGALNATFVDAAGVELNLSSGKVATIRIPTVTRGANLPATIPLFHLNTSTGLWTQEGTATLSTNSLYYEGQVTHFSTWNADQVVDSVIVNGCLNNMYGAPSVGGRISSEGIDYIGTSSVVTDTMGRFSILVKRNAKVALTASFNGFGSSVALTTGTATVDLTPCLTLTPSAVTIRLSWGQYPYDLDSHLFAPTSNGDVAEVYYANKGSLSAAPYANLDVDDVSGFGPEYITISRIARNATYRYWVRNYSNSFTPGQTGSPARIELNIRGVQSVFTPPAGETTLTRDWHAFDLKVDAYCNINVLPVNAWTTPAAPSSIGVPSYCGN